MDVVAVAPEDDSSERLAAMPGVLLNRLAAGHWMVAIRPGRLFILSFATFELFDRRVRNFVINHGIKANI